MRKKFRLHDIQMQESVELWRIDVPFVRQGKEAGPPKRPGCDSARYLRDTAYRGEALGEAAGGQGVPFGLVPVVPDVAPGLFCCVTLELELEPDDDPVESLFDPLGVPAVPGRGPQGVPLGEFPGFGEFGDIVDGFVFVPGVGGLGEFAPGTVELGVPFGVVPGVAVLPGGVAGLDCGVAGLACGVAVPADGVAAPGFAL